MAKKKVQWYEQLNDQQYFENGSFNAQKKNKNDRFVVDENNLVINSKGNKGTDVLSFGNLKLSSIEEIKEKLSFEQGYTIDITGKKIYNKDLIITVKDENAETPQTVTIKNYFKKANGKATGSTVKFIELLSDLDGSFGAGMSATKTITTEDGEEKAVAYASLVDLGLIDYREAFVLNKKGSVTGSAFNDTIVGSISNDTIKGGTGNDTIYGNTGNDKLYGGAGEDTFIFDTYTKENQILGTEYYGSGNDTVFDAKFQDTLVFSTSNVEDITFTQKKRNLIITYYDKDDTEKVTKENTVTIRNYYDKQGNVAGGFKLAALNAEGELETYTNLNEIMSESFKTEVAEARAEIAAEAERKAQEDAEKLTKYNKVKEDLENANSAISDKQTEIERLNGLLETANADKKAMEDELSLAKNSLETLNDKIEEKNSQILALENDKSDLENEVSALNTQIADKDSQISALENDKSGLENEVSALNTQIADKDSQITALETDKAGLEDEVSALNTQITNKNEQIAQLNSEKDDLSAQLTTANELVSGLTDELAELQTNYDLLLENGDSTEEELAAAREAIAQKTTELEQAQNKVSALNTQISEKDGQITALETDKSNLEGEVSALNTQIADKDSQISTLENDKSALEGEVSALNTQIADKDSQISTLETDKSNLEGEVSELNTQIADKDSQISTLNTEKSNLENVINDYKGQVTSLTEEKTALETQLAQMTTAKEHAEQELANITAAKEQAEQELENYKANYTHDDNEYNSVVSENETLQGQVDTLTGEKNELQNEYDEYKENYTKTNEEYNNLADEKDVLQSQLNNVVSYVQGTSGNDNITGTSAKEVFDVFFGEDTLTSAGADDKLRINDFYENMTFDRTDDNNDLIISYSNNNSVLLKDWFNDSADKMDTIIDITGNEYKITSKIDDINTVSTENDTITLNIGENADFKGFDFTQNGDDMVITYYYTLNEAPETELSKEYTVTGYYAEENTVEKVVVNNSDGTLNSKWNLSDFANGYVSEGTDEAETVYQRNLTTIKGNLGNDALYSITNGNVFEFNTTSTSKGSGNDIIYNATNADKIVIKGSYVDNITCSKSGNDLLVTYCGSTITIKDYYTTDEDKRIDLVEIANATSTQYPKYSLKAELSGVTITGTSENEDLFSGKNTDVIYAGVGSHKIYAHQGNDTIYSNNEGNTFEFMIKPTGQSNSYKGDGADTICNATNKDKIVIKGGASNITFTQDNNDLIIKYNKTSYYTSTTDNTITIKNYYTTNAAKRIDKLEIVGGGRYDSYSIAAELQGVTLTGTAANEDLIGGQYADTIYAGVGSHRIVGHQGDDNIYSNNEGNIIEIRPTLLTESTISDGNDNIYNATNKDKIVIVSGTNNLVFKKENNDLHIEYWYKNKINSSSGRGDIYIKNYYTTPEDQRIDRIELTNPSGHFGYTLYSIKAELQAVTLTGTSENEDLVGGTRADTIYAGEGSHFIYGHSGNDTLYSNNEGNTFEFRFQGNDYSGTYTGYFCGDGNDVIYNATNKDKIVISANTTTYLNYFNCTKDNNDLVIEYGCSNGGTIHGSSTITVKDYYLTDDDKRVDSLKVAGKTYSIADYAPEYSPVTYETVDNSIVLTPETDINFKGFDFNRNEDDMVLTYYYTKTGSESEHTKNIKIEGYYADGNTVEKVVVNNSDGTLNSNWNLADFANGYVSEGTDEAETIYDKNAETINSKLGDDIIYANNNDNVFNFKLVYDEETEKNIGDGTDTIIGATNNDKIYINIDNASNPAPLVQIGNTVYNSTDIESVYLKQNENDLYLYYDKQNANIVNLNDLDKLIIKDYYLTDENKRIDVVEFGERSKYSITNGTWTRYGTEYGEELYGSASNNDILYANEGSHTINAGFGDDIIYSNNEGNTIIFQVACAYQGYEGHYEISGGAEHLEGAGNDVIYNATNKDTLQVNNAATMTCAQNNYDLIITYNSDPNTYHKPDGYGYLHWYINEGTNTITIKDYYNTDADKRVDNIKLSSKSYSIASYAPAFDESKVNYDELQASVASFSSTNNSTTDIDYNDSNNASINDWLDSGFVTEVSG